ncbi:hypothetical protein TPA0907_58210 [Micromonospora humidisoli]|uniref:hypothetical protein n=1 Tax=Micromonospora sp. AKA109 TaxID=2733865 RepID=UPI0022BDD7BA|nr:hypothetical protein [Micromonospora sp. AKA109]GHJ11454.1 hypothetical protein TPA0907_58210 [Micromonospora sp. AKA109]
MPPIHTPGTPVWSEVDPQALATMFRDLAEIDQLWQRLDVVVLTPSAKGSAASVETTDRIRAYAYDQATTALRAALDHLRAWRTLLTAGEMPAYAHLSLLRTAHEAALFAYWLVDPSIEADARMGRGVAAQAADYAERRKFEEAAGRTTADPPSKLAVDRLSDLMAAARGLNLVRQNRNGIDVLTVAVPPTVELFDRYEPVRPGPAKAQYLYRLYSGYAHAKQWATMLGAAKQAPFDPCGRTLALTQGIDLVAVAATQRVIVAVGRALDALERLRQGPGTPEPEAGVE